MKSRRLTYSVTAFLSGLIILIISTSMAHAASSYLSTWANLYPNSTSDDAGCQLCHAASTQNLNPYGREICISLGGSISNRIQAVTGMNSDVDPTGSDNLTEINANTQPGWTPGNVNPTYSRNTCSATGLVEPPPSFILGDLDPATSNTPPVANANGPYSGTVNTAVSFSAAGSSDPDGSIVTYSWNFGDGSTGSGANPSHTYSTADTYSVTLTVTDDSGDTGTDSTTATIGLGNQPPVADAGGPYAGTTGVAFALDGSGSSDPDGSIISYSWDFGDGSSGSGATPIHTYAVAGTYNVTLTVMDDAGATDSAGTSVTINDPVNLPPVADANGPYSGIVGTPVNFDGTGSRDLDGSIVSYNWDFGDGNTGTGATPAHSYATDGNYTVTLTVTDNDGASDNANTTASIGAVNQPPVSDPNGPYSGTVGIDVVFDGSGSSDPDGNIVSYSWDFGDGSNGSGVSPGHAYSSNGTYTVTLTVTDNEGASTSSSTTAAIGDGNQPPTADANGPYNGTVGMSVNFDGTGSSDPDGSIVSYSWDFGDGSSGSGATPSHSYAAAGTYNVTLTITDDAGATDSAMTTATIVTDTPPPPPPVGDGDDGYEHEDDEYDHDEHDRDHNRNINGRRHRNWHAEH